MINTFCPYRMHVVCCFPATAHLHRCAVLFGEYVMSKIPKGISVGLDQWRVCPCLPWVAICTVAYQQARSTKLIVVGDNTKLKIGNGKYYFDGVGLESLEKNISYIAAQHSLLKTIRSSAKSLSFIIVTDGTNWSTSFITFFLVDSMRVSNVADKEMVSG